MLHGNQIVTNTTLIQTDEQAPLPDALSQLLHRVCKGIPVAGDFVFNCQMGRGRTTTGMISACLVSSTLNWDSNVNETLAEDEISLDMYDAMDGPSEEEVYLAGICHEHFRQAAK